ncbi:TetR/AcrR family transcriptional regulator [Candidatus Poriferisodalis sp.]|uniref:TetR/AcrR family transcriptional regulator n=1 Tax=Candidatus Poriferisodalis sp. TaxID=3101277 RepID=UPI003B01A843
MAALDADHDVGSGLHPAAALVEAATELLCAQPPSAVSGRRIAEAAGVNYAQIHRHFGTKRELCRQVLDRLSDAFVADAFPPGAAVPTPGTVMRHDAFVRVLTQIQLDQATLALRPEHPIIHRYSTGLKTLRPELTSDALDTLVALSCAMQLGVSIHRTPLVRSAGLDDDARLVDRELVLAIEQLHAGRGPFAGDEFAFRRLHTRGPQEPGRSRATGRAQAEQRLVAAAVGLLASRPPSSISGRQLATRAGVNYGLIHHYFGSASEVLAQASRLIRDRYYSNESGPGLIPDFFSTRAHPGYVRALTHIALDAKLAATGDHFPVVVALLDRHRSRHGEPTASERCRYLLVAAAQLAWSLFEPLFATALGRNPIELEPQAATLLARMLSFEEYPAP